jgi:hypothetical protein
MVSPGEFVFGGFPLLYTQVGGMGVAKGCEKEGTRIDAEHAEFYFRAVGACPRPIRF